MNGDADTVFCCTKLLSGRHLILERSVARILTVVNIKADLLQKPTNASFAVPIPISDPD